jgi:purine nucleoside phosphorylase
VDEYYDQVDRAADYIRSKLEPADVALVLGSGLKTFTEELTSRKVRTT